MSDTLHQRRKLSSQQRNNIDNDSDDNNGKRDRRMRPSRDIDTTADSSSVSLLSFVMFASVIAVVAFAAGVCGGVLLAVDAPSTASSFQRSIFNALPFSASLAATMAATASARPDNSQSAEYVEFAGYDSVQQRPLWQHRTLAQTPRRRITGVEVHPLLRAGNGWLDDVGVELIVMSPHSTLRKHQHVHASSYVMVVTGSGRVEMDEEAVEPAAEVHTAAMAAAAAAMAAAEAASNGAPVKRVYPHRRPSLRPTLRHTLSVGDQLMIPARYWHSVVAGADGLSFYSLNSPPILPGGDAHDVVMYGDDDAEAEK